MSTVNRKRAKPVSSPRDAEENFMGGISYVPSPLVQLRMMAASCFFGEPQYYIPGTTSGSYLAATAHPLCLAALSPVLDLEQTGTSADRLVAAIDRALEFDPEATLMEAVRLRNEDHIRLTPQVILVRAAMHHRVRGTELLRKYAPDILQRVDEPASGLAYFLSLHKEKAKRIPNSLKKAWKSFLEKQGEYALAKYRTAGNEVALVDVVNLVHAHSEPIDKLMRGQLSMAGKSWEAIVSEKGGTPEAWAEALPKLLNPKGHMALLRNLRNLQKAGLLTPDVMTALKAGVVGGKQMPFRYYSAYNSMVAAGSPGYVLDGLAEALDLSVQNLPRFKGRVMSLCDNSGSAQSATTSEHGTMKVSTIGNLLATLTGKQADEGYAGIFGNKLNVVPVRKTDSTLTQVNQLDKAAADIGQATENGVWLFFDKAIRQREHWDHIFVYSDMQAGHGGLYGTNPSEYKDFLVRGGRYIDVAVLIAKYRREVNPDVMVYTVQIGGYSNTLVPEYYHRTFVLGGWSDSVLRFAGEMSRIYEDQESITRH